MENKEQTKRDIAVLTLGALGIVYGDMGTSPLYTLRECFSPAHHIDPTAENVFGVLSLIFWALTVTISIKYMLVVMRADNRGEGGILALMALGLSKLADGTKRQRFALIAMALFGASLLYGDGMITPAISVLSAVEGLEVATPLFQPYVLPITIAILIALFLCQRHGTSRIGAVFGPIMMLWFAVLGLLGIASIVDEPRVLLAVNPFQGLFFFARHGWAGFLVLGSVFLALTGGEAIYADMGHFGRRPIQWGWYGVALPSLLLNYFGQGALILTDPDSVASPFYALAPAWGLMPMVVLATIATVIASQAVISGAFSLTRQAVMLGYLPRISIVHTSSREIGQIYVPTVNHILMVATVGLVLGFRSSSNLAAAYGVAVTMTMLITTLLLYTVVRNQFGWSRWKAGITLSIFLVFDAGFCASALMKIPHGGWFPLVVGAGIYVMMATWYKGRRIIRERLQERMPPLDTFVNVILPNEPNLTRVPGTAVFLSGNPADIPPVLLHNLRYNKILHEATVIMTFVFENIPHVPRPERVTVEKLGLGFYRVRARYGFMESPHMQDILVLCAEHGLDIPFATTGFFIGRETIRTTSRPGMPVWRQKLFAFLSRNAQGATPFFDIPPNQVVELGVQVQL
ncbi:MAG: system potassium uptake protein [Candidatus Hydrogenedentes bacterium]|nr:system potassium uptake protein [Candidatus Hydrogenedentota bacterium]